MAEIRLDVDVDTFLDECSVYEIDAVIDWLDTRGKLQDYITDGDSGLITLPKDDSIQGLDWNDAIIKLLKNRMGISKEDEETILRISKKFI